MFRIDLLGLVPWDLMLMIAFDVEDQNCKLASAFAFLKWLKLVRCYRIVYVFKYLEQYSKSFSQLAVTLVRNLTYLFFMLHAASCMFWWAPVRRNRWAGLMT